MSGLSALVLAVCVGVQISSCTNLCFPVVCVLAYTSTGSVFNHYTSSGMYVLGQVLVFWGQISTVQYFHPLSTPTSILRAWQY